MKRAASIGLIATALVVALVGWIGWRWYDNRYPTWKEEVQLSDGRVIVVKQRHEYYEGYGTNQSWVTFALPEMGGERTWHSHLAPQRIDIYLGKVYVFGSPRGERQFEYYRLPKYYLVAFEWSGKDFERIPFLEVPEVIRQAENIYSCVPDKRTELISLTIKQQEWCPITGDRWKFGKTINLDDYRALAMFYARLGNTIPATE